MVSRSSKAKRIKAAEQNWKRSASAQLPVTVVVITFDFDVFYCFTQLCFFRYTHIHFAIDLEQWSILKVLLLTGAKIFMVPSTATMENVFCISCASSTLNCIQCEILLTEWLVSRTDAEGESDIFDWLFLKLSKCFAPLLCGKPKSNGENIMLKWTLVHCPEHTVYK